MKYRILVIMFAAACASSPKTIEKPKSDAKPGTKTCTESSVRADLKSKGKWVWEGNCKNEEISVKNSIKVGGGTIDGSGKAKFKWSGTNNKCDEIPRNSDFAIFHLNGSGGVVKNLEITQSPEGIHMTGSSNTVDAVYWPKICEDAVTNTGRNSVVKNSIFTNGPDKAFQSNGGSARLENNKFAGIDRAIASCSDKADPGNHPTANCKTASHNTAIGNTIYGCSGYALRASGKKSKNAAGSLKALKNTITDCSCAIQSEEDGTVYATENDLSGGTAFCTKAQGQIFDCNNKTSGKYSEGKEPKKECSF